MQKTKFGISVGLMGALMYFGCLFGGYIVGILFLGYIMLVEDNPWLRKTAVKEFMLLVAFSLISTLLGFVPNIFDLIDKICYIFDERFTVAILTKIHSVLECILGILKPVLFVILGLKAMGQGTINIPVIDDMTSKNME